MTFLRHGAAGERFPFPLFFLHIYSIYAVLINLGCDQLVTCCGHFGLDGTGNGLSKCNSNGNCPSSSLCRRRHTHRAVVVLTF